MEKVLILGSNGYLGSNLALKMKEEGFEVLLSGRSSHSLLSNVKYVQCDLLDTKQVEKLFANKVDYVYFFSGITGNAEESFAASEKFLLGNELILLNVLNEIRKLTNRPKIIFPSSRLVYKGGERILLSESAELNPKTIYSVNKLSCEYYLKIYSKNFGINYSIFRIALPYSTNLLNSDISYGVMSDLMLKAKNGEDLDVFGDGEQNVNLVHIDDLIEIIIKASVNEESSNECYNIGGPDVYQIREVLELISKAYKVKCNYIKWPKELRDSDQGHLILDSSKVLKLTDYSFKNRFVSWLNQNVQ